MSQSALAFNEAAPPSVFNFGAHAVRIVMRGDAPWFVAADVCAALDYANTSKAVADHLDDDERMTLTAGYSQSASGLTTGSTVAKSDSHSGKRGGARLMTIINESGLYALVLRSRKPEARKFAKWVTSEVLPAIRKTGRYEKPGLEMTVNEMVADFVRQIETPNGVPAVLFMPLVNAVLRKQGFTFLLPDEQEREITDRLNRLGDLFNPFSAPFSDVIGALRALRGLHPRLGMDQPSYRQVIKRIR